jgi:hypothetical protein
MAPPGLTAQPQPGGSTICSGSQIELAIRAAHKALGACGVEISPRKVNRIVHRFAARAKTHGWTFHQFVSDAANLSPKQRNRLLAQPDWARVIAYLDPTGETAVNNVLRHGGASAQ